MKIEIVKVPRRPPWPVWAVLIVLLWLSLGCAVVVLERHLNQPASLCLFKRITHIPCPTCGFTRGGQLLLGGHLGLAWLCNPLLFSVLILFFGLTIFRLLFARSLRLRLDPKEKTFAWLLAITLFIANWIYVILYVG